MSNYIPGLKQPKSYFARRINLLSYRPAFLADPRKYEKGNNLNQDRKSTAEVIEIKGKLLPKKIAA